MAFKQFELSNHLGNVLATVLDRRSLHNIDTAIVGTDSTFTTLWDADMVGAQDYYPGGMLLPNRVYLADSTGTGKYRYGFNGMERDDDWNGAGNEYDFGARIYDARLGRWLTRDKMEDFYPSLSTYAYVNNNPMFFVDLDGNAHFTYYRYITDIGEITVKVQDKKGTIAMSFRDDNGVYHFYQHYERNVIVDMRTGLEEGENLSSTGGYAAGGKPVSILEGLDEMVEPSEETFWVVGGGVHWTSKNADGTFAQGQETTIGEDAGFNEIDQILGAIGLVRTASSVGGAMAATKSITKASNVNAAFQ